MENILFNINGIAALLERLNVSKAAGPCPLLKSCARSVFPYLKIIFGKSLNDFFLPNDWRIASVVPVHKYGPCDILNYRPISLTSVSCKILEYILYTFIVQDMDAHSLLNPKQHGFQRGLSCVTQSTEFTVLAICPRQWITVKLSPVFSSTSVKRLMSYLTTYC